MLLRPLGHATAVECTRRREAVANRRRSAAVQPSATTAGAGFETLAARAPQPAGRGGVVLGGAGFPPLDGAAGRCRRLRLGFRPCPRPPPRLPRIPPAARSAGGRRRSG